MADVAPATNISIATLDVQAVSAKIILYASFYVPKEKEQTSISLFYSFDFDVFFSSAFSVIITTVKVTMKPPMKNNLSILSPSNAKKYPTIKSSRLWDE